MSTKLYAVVSNNAPYIKSVKGKSVTVVPVADSKDEKSFNFDGVFNSSDFSGLSKSISSIIHEAFSGYNVTITSCGLSDTGSGQVLHGSGFSSKNGIIPTIIREMFSKANGSDHLISISMLQIGENHKLTDVLNPHNRKMKVKRNQKVGVVVEHLSSFVCTNAEQACSVYSEGHKAESAFKALRRDVIFTLSISQKHQDNVSTSGVLSKIVVLDLIGHENEPDNTGIKALFKSLIKGKHRDYASPSDLLIGDSIINSKSSVVIACAVSEDGGRGMDVVRLFELAKLGSGIKSNPHKNKPDLTNYLAELRNDIKTVRERIMHQATPEKKDVSQLESLVADLNDVKRTSWNQTIALSNLYAEERNSNLADKGLLWVLESGKSSNHEEIKELQDRVSELSTKQKEQKRVHEQLKEELKNEIDMYTKSVESGKSDDSQTKSRIGRIQTMKESFKKETEKLNKTKEVLKQTKEQLRKQKEAGLDIASFNFEMTVRKLQEDRNRMKKENEQIVDDEVEKMKIETAHEKAMLEMTSSSSGLHLDESDQLKQAVELSTVKLEKSAITTQLDILRKEKRQLEDHINILADKHIKQAEIQQLQNLQTFRAYREVFEEFKADLDSRWRGLLDDAIQDAVYLNSRNTELTQENEQLKLEVKQLKDALSRGGIPPPGKSITN